MSRGSVWHLRGLVEYNCFPKYTFWNFIPFMTLQLFALLWNLSFSISYHIMLYMTGWSKTTEGISIDNEIVFTLILSSNRFKFYVLWLLKSSKTLRQVDTSLGWLEGTTIVIERQLCFHMDFCKTWGFPMIEGTWCYWEIRLVGSSFQFYLCLC